MSETGVQTTAGPALHMKAQPRHHPGRPISSVLRALDVLADPWAYLLLREAFFGIRRFEDFQRNLGVARNVLSARLDHLVEEEVLNRRLYSRRPERFEYRMTRQGRDFYPAIVALMQWGDRWFPDPDGPPLQLIHEPCGAPLKAIVVCGSCSQELNVTDVQALDGPGAGPETKHAPPATRRRGGAEAYERGRPCSVARALSVIGDRWSFRILRESFFGVKRFEELLRNLGIARNILTQRLQKLVDDGVLARTLYQTRPDRHEYRLTEAGLDLYPALTMFMNWGDTWRCPPEGQPLLLRHLSCGAVQVPRLVCASCGEAVTSGTTGYVARYDIGAFSRSNTPP